VNAIDDARAALLAARAAQDAALDRQVSATAALRSAQSALAAAQRVGGRAAVAAATKAAASAQAQLDEARRGVVSAAAQVAEALAVSSAVTDPRTLADALDARVPALLMPVRLEVKFRQAALAAGAAELWVRVFPDTCSIDTFSPELTAIEVGDARAYWGRVWQAAATRTANGQPGGPWWRATARAGRRGWSTATSRPTRPASRRPVPRVRWS